MPGRRYRIAPAVAHRDIEGQTLLLVPDEADLLTLNATGRFIWQRLLKRQPVETITRAFARSFGVTAAIAERDVHAFVKMLEARGLIGRG